MQKIQRIQKKRSSIGHKGKKYNRSNSKKEVQWITKERSSMGQI